MKRIVALVLALAMLFALAACGSGDSSSGSTDEITVNIWDNNQLEGLQTIADEWTEQSGIKVNIQVIDWDNYWTLLEAGASGGEMPDVFWMHSNNAQLYMENDQLLNLNDYIASSDTVKMENYYEGITSLYQLNGNQYAIPKDHDTIALLYNKAIFDRFGVEYPNDNWTWEDFYNAGKAITDAGKAEGIYGVACDTTNDQDGYFNIIYSYGGGVINADHTASLWNSNETKQAMELVGRLCSDVYTPQATVSENGTDTLFKNGLAAMITQGSWMIKSFYDDENSGNYAWAMLPYCDRNGNGTCEKEERVSLYNGLGWAAAANTANPDACWSLIEWFSSYDMQVKQADLGVTLAGYVGADDSFPAAFEGMDITPFLTIEDAGTLVFRPYSKYTSRWEEQYKTELVAAWNDPSQMNTILDNLANEMNALLAEEQQ